MNSIISLIVKKDFKVTDKILDQFIEQAKHLPRKICDCECHHCSILNIDKHSSIEIISNFQCIECNCKPIPYNASQFDILHWKFKHAWKKRNGIPRNVVWSKYPAWLKNELVFMTLLLTIYNNDSKT